MYSEPLLDHFRNPRNAGELPPPAVVVDVANPACGDLLRLSVLWRDGRVEQAAFLVKGCTASIAAGSALTVWLQGRRREDLRSLSAKQIAAAVEEALGGLPAESQHAAALCADGVAAVLRQS